MIKYVKGDVLNVKTDYVAHQVNTLGIMGSGLALDIKNKYPNVFVEYKRKCNELGEGLIGTYIPIQVPDSHLIILNCFSQKGMSRTQRTTDYEAVKKVFKQIEKSIKPGKVISVPYKYGCGLANGDWNTVHKIFKDIFDKSDVILQIVRRWEWTEREKEL